MAISRYTNVPYEKLGYAIRWEQCRTQYFQAVGRMDDAQESLMKLRGYQQRSINEAEELTA